MTGWLTMKILTLARIVLLKKPSQTHRKQLLTYILVFLALLEVLSFHLIRNFFAMNKQTSKLTNKQANKQINKQTNGHALLISKI